MKRTNLSEKIVKALLQLGLTEKEIAVYVCLLEYGGQAIQEISRITGVNRVTIYAAIDQLKSRGLASESRKNKRKLFVAESPERLLSILESKKRNVAKEEQILSSAILPVLNAIDINPKEKPVFKFFEGAEGINRVYDEYVSKKKDILSCGSYETASKAVSLKMESEFFRFLKDKKILYRAILEDTPLNHRYSESGKGIVHTKYLPEDEKVSADIVVAESSITALISYDRMCATVIEDEAIAKSVRFYLEFMWDNLKTS